MTTPAPSFAGLVLAAGASSRMGYPKALLPTPAQLPLAVHQLRLLRAAGCAPVAVVVGAHANAIAAKITEGEVIKNPDWERGRLTSIQAGLRGLPGAHGYLLLPVDTVGVRRETLAALLAARGGPVVRPYHQGQPGRLLRLDRATADELLAIPATDLRLDEWMASRIRALAVDDPAVLNNINTPDDWAAARLLLEQ